MTTVSTKHRVILDTTSSGRVRLTCEECGEALVNQPHMTDIRWLILAAQFLDKHPSKVEDYGTIPANLRSQVDQIYSINPVNDNEHEFAGLLESAIQRAWTLGLSRDEVAAIIEQKLRQKHFQARVMP